MKAGIRNETRAGLGVLIPLSQTLHVALLVLGWRSESERDQRPCLFLRELLTDGSPKNHMQPQKALKKLLNRDFIGQLPGGHHSALSPSDYILGKDALSSNFLQTAPPVSHPHNSVAALM